MKCANVQRANSCVNFCFPFFLLDREFSVCVLTGWLHVLLLGSVASATIFATLQNPKQPVPEICYGEVFRLRLYIKLQFLAKGCRKSGDYRLQSCWPRIKSSLMLITCSRTVVIHYAALTERALTKD